MTKRFIVLGILSINCVARAKVGDKPVVQKNPSQVEGVDTEDSDETIDSDDNSSSVADTDGGEIDETLEAELDPQNQDLVDLNLTLGKRWYDKSTLVAQGLQLTTEWGIDDLPLRLGPSLRYFDLKPSGNFFKKGTLLEFGFRASFVYDLEDFLPYIALDYTLFSSGSLNGHQTIDDVETAAALGLDTKGYDLVAGTSIFLGDYSIVVEVSLTNKSDVKLDGTTTTKELVNDEVVIDTSSSNSTTKDKFKSLNVGLGFEF